MRKIKLFSLFVALVCAASLWATPEVPKTWTYDNCEVTLRVDGTLYVDSRDNSPVEMDATEKPNTQHMYPWHLDGYGALVTKVEVSDKITAISDYAFHGLQNMTEVKLGYNVETIGEGAFRDCYGLTTFSTDFSNAHSHLKTIKRVAFAYCLNLSSVILAEESNGLETIGDMAFNGCTALTTITLPATITHIGARAFLNCTNITDVYCNPTAKYLTWDDLGGGFDFKENKATILHVHPDQFDAYKKKFWSLNFTIQGDFPRGTLTNYESGTCYVNLANGTLTVTPKNGISGELAIIPSNMSYEWGKTQYAYDVLHIVVADGITNIPEGAFSALRITEDIQIGKDVQTIGVASFRNSKRVTSIELPEGLTSIGAAAFADCSALTSITFPASMRNFGFRAFAYSGLTDVYCPIDAKDFTVLGTEDTKDMKKANSLFTYCNVKFHVYADQLTAYQNIFANADEVTGTNVTVVGDMVRTWTSGTCTVTLDNGVLTVAPTNGVSGEMGNDDTNPWVYYNEITSVVVTDGVTRIGDNAFKYLDIVSVSIGKDVTEIGDYAFESCTNLTSITLPEGITSIGNQAFYGSSYLESITLPESLESIGNSAFRDCFGLTSFTIPANVRSIGANAFRYCYLISNVYCYAAASDLNWEYSDYNEISGEYEDDPPEFMDGKATICHVYADQLTAYQTKFPDINVTFVGDLGGATIGENDNADAINEFLEANDGKDVEGLTIERPIYRNNYYNTLCLPFAMTAAQIAASSLAGAEIKAFTSAQVVDNTLKLQLTQVTEMEAGVPYFVKYSEADALTKRDFPTVNFDNEPKGVTFNGVTLQGTFAGFNMPAQTADSHSYLFLGQNNKLYWPNEAGKIKPFRAYFIVETGSIHGAPHRGMPAMFVETDEATGVENVLNSDVQSIKRFENGQLVIIRNGVRCNAAGQIVK